MPVKMTPIDSAASDAILVGDPRRAFALAQELTVQPKMSHQARGLWGYTGMTVDGTPLTVQSTGSGGPSAVPVIGDLAAQGTGRMIRLGTCLAIDAERQCRRPAPGRTGRGRRRCRPGPERRSGFRPAGSNGSSPPWKASAGRRRSRAMTWSSGMNPRDPAGRTRVRRLPGTSRRRRPSPCADGWEFPPPPF